MTRALHWRIVVLQTALFVILVFASGFLYWTANFTHSYEQEQLTSQKIVFPEAGSAGLAALPSSDASAMGQYAGQPLDDGNKAKVYADNFIGAHLRAVAGGLTYSEMSAKAQAAPTDARLAAQVLTLFKGETLRGLLLNAYGWWTIGTYSLYAAIGLTLAAAIMLVALLFEIFLAPRMKAGGHAAGG
jgi:hypothetical protein